MFSFSFSLNFQIGLFLSNIFFYTIRISSCLFLFDAQRFSIAHVKNIQNIHFHFPFLFSNYIFLFCSCMAQSKLAFALFCLMHQLLATAPIADCRRQSLPDFHLHAHGSDWIHPAKSKPDWTQPCVQKLSVIKKLFIENIIPSKSYILTLSVLWD